MLVQEGGDLLDRLRAFGQDGIQLKDVEKVRPLIELHVDTDLARAFDEAARVVEQYFGSPDLQVQRGQSREVLVLGVLRLGQRV